MRTAEDMRKTRKKLSCKKMIRKREDAARTIERRNLAVIAEEMENRMMKQQQAIKQNRFNDKEERVKKCIFLNFE